MILLQLIALPFAIVFGLIVLLFKLTGLAFGFMMQIVIGSITLVVLGLKWVWDQLANILGIFIIIVVSLAIWVWERPIVEAGWIQFKKAFKIKLK